MGAADSQVMFLSGLDLGQSQDHTALAVLERAKAPDPDRPERRVNHYSVRHLQRFPPGTAYGDVAAVLAERFADPPLAGSSLAVDITGVGRPVLDLLRKARIGGTIRPITVTGGHEARPDDNGGWLVPKKEIVSTLQVLLQGRRLKVAQTLPQAPTLVQELLNFKAKVTTAAADSFEDWRENPHDDLVLAIGIAAWVGERAVKRFWSA
jgi:hypothetical protein